MTEQKIRNWNAYQAHQKTVSDFNMFSKKGIHATDLDFVRVENGNALILEGKQSNGSYEVKIPVAQVRVLRFFESQPNTHVYIVVYTKLNQQKQRKYYVLPPGTVSAYRNERDENGTQCFYVPLGAMAGPFNEEKFVEWTRNKLDSFKLHRRQQ